MTERERVCLRCGKTIKADVCRCPHCGGRTAIKGSKESEKKYLVG